MADKKIAAELDRELYRKEQIRRVLASDQAALAWLERVGSWPSSDPDIREITRAAERRLRWRR